MAQPAQEYRYTYAEYLSYERDTELKHEYCAGEILAMAGGSRRHSALASRVSAALEAGRKPGCNAFQSDQRVRVLATGRATYPDASMVFKRLEGTPPIAMTRPSRTRRSSSRCCLHRRNR